MAHCPLLVWVLLCNMQCPLIVKPGTGLGLELCLSFTTPCLGSPTHLCRPCVADIKLSYTGQGLVNAPLLATGETQLVDESSRGVMMSWEEPLMQAHSAAICQEGSDVLNVSPNLGQNVA